MDGASDGLSELHVKFTVVLLSEQNAADADEKDILNIYDLRLCGADLNPKQLAGCRFAEKHVLFCFPNTVFGSQQQTEAGGTEDGYFQGARFVSISAADRRQRTEDWATPRGTRKRRACHSPFKRLALGSRNLRGRSPKWIAKMSNRKKRTVSPEARKRMAEAQRMRRAKERKANG
jgi:hypothetical protein